MGVTNAQSGTRVDEVADGIYRINTPFRDVPGGFSFNQYLIRDDQPLLYHTGPRARHGLIREALATLIKPEDLRFVAFSHFESDECGSVVEFMGLAPNALPLCGQVNGMVNGDCFGRPAKILADQETLSLGAHRVRWFDTPHLPHAWECGHMLEESTATLLCGDLFTQGGSDLPYVTSADILGPSEAFRQQFDYYSHTKNGRSLLARLAATKPTTLACMHGSAWQGDGGPLLEALAESLDS